MKAVVKKDIAPLYTKPTRDCELADEALYGTTVEILEEVGEDWVRLRTHYRYEGFTPASCLETDPTLVQKWEDVPKKTVIRAYVDIQKEPKVEEARLTSLPRGGLLSVLSPANEDGWLKVLLPDGREGYTKESYLGDHVTAWDPQDEAALRLALADTALSYMGTQYRWGGKTPLGIDCSGLTSMAYMLNGILIYRDAAIKPDFPVRQIDPKEAKMGDLLFFPGHVALALGEGRYVHSTARKGDEGVVINSLDPGAPDFRRDLLEKLTHAGTIF